MKRNERVQLYQKTVRRLAIESLGARCNKCGSTDSDDLHVHHKNGDLNHFDKKQLELLCSKCHALTHGHNMSFLRRASSEPRTRTTFYVDASAWEKFKEICIREGESASQKLEQWVREYVVDHEPGNPQLRLDRLLQVKLQKLCHCGRLAAYQVWAKNGWRGLLCNSCFTRNQKAGLLKRWKTL